MENKKLRDRIFKAADELCAQGIQKPTNDQVRGRLGGGSLSQISPVMREWREVQARSQEVVAEMPDGLKKVVEVALSKVWLSANEIANDQLTRHKMKSEEALAQAGEEREELLAELKTLEGKVQELEKVNEKVQAEAHRLIDELDGKNDRLREYEIEASGLKSTLAARDSELRSLGSRLEEAMKDNQAFKNELLEIARSSMKVADQE